MIKHSPSFSSKEPIEIADFTPWYQNRMNAMEFQGDYDRENQRPSPYIIQFNQIPLQAFGSLAGYSTRYVPPTYAYVHARIIVGMQTTYRRSIFKSAITASTVITRVANHNLPAVHFPHFDKCNEY